MTQTKHRAKVGYFSPLLLLNIKNLSFGIQHDIYKKILQ